MYRHQAKGCSKEYNQITKKNFMNSMFEGVLNFACFTQFWWTFMETLTLGILLSLSSLVGNGESSMRQA